MDSQGGLVVNASYKDLPLGPNLPRETFILPGLEEIEVLENSSLTRALALHLQSKDQTPNVLYGIEIKSNGSERSSRIPLVRVSEATASIWKIGTGIKSLQKAAVALNDLVSFLNSHANEGQLSPKKVLVLKEDEALYIKENSEYHRFVSDIVRENNLHLFSLKFIKELISDPFNNMDSLLAGEERIFGLENNK